MPSGQVSFHFPTLHSWEMGRRSVSFLLFQGGRDGHRRPGNLPKVKWQASCGFLSLLVRQKGHEASPVRASVLGASPPDPAGRGDPRLGGQAVQTASSGEPPDPGIACASSVTPCALLSAPCPWGAPEEPSLLGAPEGRPVENKPPHFTDGKTEPHRGKAICLTSQLGAVWRQGGGKSLFSPSEQVKITC